MPVIKQGDVKSYYNVLGTTFGKFLKRADINSINISQEVLGSKSPKCERFDLN